MPKRYCFVDETGLETRGRLFVVACLVFDTNAQEFMELCERYEQETGKGKFKWGKAKHELRMKYIRRVFKNSSFRGRLRFAVFHDTRKYDMATVSAIRRAISIDRDMQHSAVNVVVDALSKAKRREYSRELRSFGISVHDVRGIAKDENHALVRLADAIAGFIRDAIDEPDSEIARLFAEAKRNGTLVEV